MEKKFTKGEWTIDSWFANGNTCYWQNIKSEEGKTIVEVKGIHYGNQNEECDANAKLIAAAPDMLEALLWIYNDPEAFNDLFPTHQERIKAAIKKATE